MIFFKWYLKLFNFIAAKRIQNEDLDLRRIHSHTVAVLSTGLLMWAYAFLAWFTIASPIPGIIGFVCSSIHLLSPLLFRISNNAFLISNIMIGSGMVHQGTFGFYSGGFESHILIWFGILPMLGGIIAGRKAAVQWAILCSLWAGVYLYLDVTGYQFPDLISQRGHLIAHAFLVFGWIFLSSSIIYVLLVLNESKEKLLAEQGQKIDDLFRVLFHDLAGPLSRISIGLNISRKETDKEHKEMGLEIAAKATNAMLEITQNVRKMYAVRKGKISTDLSFCSLNECIEYLEKLYAAELEKKHIKIDYDFKKHQGLSLFVEPVSFKNQVLGNVLSNAIKFSPPSSKISISAYPSGNQHYVVEIKDQGIGMPESLMDSLFDITKKTSRPGTAGESGTGFGMHIMKSFVEMYQGKIQIESTEENPEKQGTCIKLMLRAEWNKGGSPLPE